MQSVIVCRGMWIVQMFFGTPFHWNFKSFVASMSTAKKLCPNYISLTKLVAKFPLREPIAFINSSDECWLTVSTDQQKFKLLILLTFNKMCFHEMFFVVMVALTWSGGFYKSELRLNSWNALNRLLRNRVN